MNGEARSRRQLLVLGAAALPLLGLFGCKKKEREAPTEPTAACSDVSDLPPEEVQLRVRLAYVDRTPFPDKLCSGCQQFTEPSAGQACGACKVVPGKIAAGGYCKLFAPKA